MASSTRLRRRLFMHPAHGTVGVSGGGTAPGPYCRAVSFSTDAPIAAPLRVVLAACKSDADACAAMAPFQRAIDRHCGVPCRHVMLDVMEAGSESWANVDCLVLFRRGLHMARRWADLDAAALVWPSEDQCQRETPPHRNRGASGDATEFPESQIGIIPATRRHPVLKGVEPFVSRLDVFQRVRIPDDALLLLAGATAGEVQPVAWIEPDGDRRAFHTTLGRPEDFRRPDFVRLLLNVLAWIGPAGQIGGGFVE